MSSAAILWLRSDLRLDDHPALEAALKSGLPIIPVFVWDPKAEGAWPLGAASRWWLHHSLQSLSDQLKGLGSKMILRSGPSIKELLSLAQQSNADRIYFCERYEPYARECEDQLISQAKKSGIQCFRHSGNLLFHPDQIRSKQDQVYQVYTPFSKTCFERLSEISEPTATPKRISSPRSWPSGLRLQELGLLPKIAWDEGFYKHWTPGVEGARKLFNLLQKGKVASYHDQRDFPGIDGTSRLSPHLHFGEISVRRLWHLLHPSGTRLTKGLHTYLKEILWREFAYHLLFHFPHTPEQPLRTEFNKFPWNPKKAHLIAWQRGQTGYPLVDAGMRQLWRTGWMHNRVRMVVASFLVKHLLTPWQEGSRWFWDTLVDADLASNTMGWQWASGCGADAAPYFRIFNPMMQSEKFDPKGEYLHTWVPELKSLKAPDIHRPWLAQELFSKSSYPPPLVDHQKARELALEALTKISKRKSA